MDTTIHTFTEGQLSKAIGIWIKSYTKNSSSFDLKCKNEGYETAMAKTIITNLKKK